MTTVRPHAPLAPEDPRHGKRAGYLAGCPCGPCARAHARYSKRYRMLRAQGVKSLDVPAGPVAEHIRYLSESMTLGAIAAAAGVSETVVYSAKRRTKVRPETARRILAVKPLETSGTHHISPVGTVRRIRALNAMGYSLRRISVEAGLCHGWVVALASGRGSAWVEASTAAAVRRVYEQWSMTIPVGTTRAERSGIALARAGALRKGWVPPLAWDDIDHDPFPACTEGKVSPLEEAEWLAQTGESFAAAAARMGITPDGLDALLRRHDRLDLHRVMRAREMRAA